ncbi:16S rRNA (cytosine(967)-C(5))-methyltransferase RsmB [Paenibacillus filicis]|uniref:16S rRNA (cytosine(967)-C(5))-methyltransferase n=1 Tax=Paenibacillus filicis TaxID=669464 RepID=A0ABU9DSU9_9BACL
MSEHSSDRKPDQPGKTASRRTGTPGAQGKNGTAHRPGATGGKSSSGGAKPAGRLASGHKPVRGTAREAALDVLTRVEVDRAYSNLLLNQTLQAYKLDKPDAGLATEIVYGTVQRLNTIDYYLGRFVAKGLAKLEPWVRSLLRLSLYQMLYLDRVPDHAVVNEAVNLAKRRGHTGISGMVNGVLRNVIRSKAELVLPDGLAPAAKIALEESHPEWLVRRWIAQYGEETARNICRANNEAPRVSLRVNRMRTEPSQLLERLRGQGLEAEASALAPAGVVVRGGGNMALTPEFERGLYSVQDESSMLVAEWVDPQPGERVLDCCAAPGGKSMHLAEKMGDRGEVVACDVHEHKRQLIDDQAQRLGLKSIRTLTADARQLADHYPPGSFDRILLDAPCSGLGVIRRKPDLKWSKSEAEIAAISQIQQELLDAVAPLLKPGGVLVYSTCTVERSENEEAVNRFLAGHPEFHPDPSPPWVGSPGHGGAVAAGSPDAGVADAKEVSSVSTGSASSMIQIMPYDYGSDGFFIARLRRRA